MSVSPLDTKKSASTVSSNGYSNGNGKKSDSPSLHIEWTPDRIKAIDIATGQIAEGPSLATISNKFSSRNALVGVGHSSVFLKAIRLPKADPADLRNLISIQLGTLFPLPSDQLSFDFFQTNDLGPEGMLTLVVAIRSDDLRQIRSDLSAAGFVPTRVLPIALAAPAVALAAGRTDAIIADKETTGLALDLVLDGILRSSRVAPLSANPEVEVQRTLAASKAESASVLSLGDIDLPEATVSRQSLLSLLHQAPHLNFELLEDRALSLKKHVDSRMRLAILLMLAALCFIAGVWSMYSDIETAQQSQQASWNSRINHERTIEKAETAHLAQISPVNQTITRAFYPGQRLSDITSIVTDSLPKNAWLTGLTLQRGMPLEIRGTAEASSDVAHIISNLGANPRFRDVRLVFANSGQINKTTIVQFDISAVCVGNLPMPEPIKVKAKGRGTPVANTTAATSSTGAAQ
jgi:Tfp pilus assembly protein PilN